MEKLIVFDVDGVLIDSEQRYYTAVAATVNHYHTGRIVPCSVREVSIAKMRGGLNDDIDCIQYFLLRVAGISIPDKEVLSTYLSFADAPAAMAAETWIPWHKDFLPGLQHLTGAQLGIFTSRPYKDLWASIGLHRDKFDILIDPCHVSTMDDCVDYIGRKKPSGYGLRRMGLSGKQVVYIGDTLDDARAADDANVSFIGVVPDLAEEHSPMRGVFMEYNPDIALVANVAHLMLPPDGLGGVLERTYLRRLGGTFFDTFMETA